MAKVEYKINALSSQTEGDPKSSAERQIKKKNKKKKQLLESVKVEDEQETNRDIPSVEGNSQYVDMSAESRKKKLKKKLLKETAISKEGSKETGVEREKKGSKKRKKQSLLETAEIEDEEDVNWKGSPKAMNTTAGSGKSDEEKQLLKETAVAEEKQEASGINLVEEENQTLTNEMVDRLKKKKKKRLLKEAAQADRRGVCYLSRIPPHMDHVKLRHILCRYGEIQRIYLAPEVNKHRVQYRVQRRKADGLEDLGFSEGWVEFTNKSIAKRVANMLNGEQMGGRKRSQFYYDLWNIKYLSKFKWDDLTEEIAYKSAIREQKLALELSAAKRERDFYLSKVEKSRALSSIEERLKKKQKVQLETGGEFSVSIPKVIRQFAQTKPIADRAEENRPRLSKDVLAGVFGGS
ncbi:pre-rRNA-processing protein ESF2 isoform X1 [Ricinus communis]|uniref:pre-rRNA-processing protein ESF2 isoform X1 n=1 Tax=Ricinus communis TaxID=3988 RepID=UPI00201A25F6|nr:pre-rRNA-processing protein ESF2 isoform X1 [Ricinus communis]XP_015578995.2 pre-rRNA-processing protein ESF2 isoform X1 [Ricinus communis]XP_015578996.2 pre-rRNA-processing protein ESF2 isoform X1 [Ricinus communis]